MASPLSVSSRAVAGSKQVAPVANESLLSSDSLSAPHSSTTAQRAFYLVHANIAFYAFFWWLNQPVLPFLSKELGSDNQVFGQFQSFTQLVQLIGAPLIGRLIDLRGSKLALVVSHAMACLSYGLLWQANSIPLLFFSQVPTIAMAAMHSSQAYITLISTPEDRAKQIGRVSLSYGIGFLFGPVVGGTLAKTIGYHAVALIGSIGSAIVCLVMVAFLPDIQPSHKIEDAAVIAGPASPSTPAPKGNWLAGTRLLAVPSIRTIILVKFCLATALAVYRTCFSLVAKDQYGMDAQQHGFLLSGVGGTTILVNVFAIGWLTRRFGERTIVTWCIKIVVAMFLLSAFAALSLGALLTYLVPMSIGGIVSATILTSCLTKSATLEDAGTVLGLDMSTGSAARVIAPALGGWLLDAAGYQTVSVFAATLAIGAWVLASWSHQWGGADAVTAKSEVTDDEAELKPLRKKDL